MLVLWNNTSPMNRMEIVAAGEGDEESRVLYNNRDGTWIDENGNLYEESMKRNVFRKQIREWKTFLFL